MSDIVERLHVYGRSEFGQSVPGFMFVEAATEIARLRAELAEARDKALDEAAEAVLGYIHPDYGRLPGEPFASAAIRALKSQKPQED